MTTLIFTVANNGYDLIFSRCIDSQRAYAARRGYRYALLRRPYWCSFLDSAWLKIPLLQTALNAGYRWVVFLDADCAVRASAPAVESVHVDGKSLYLGRGFSGNYNSGVIIVRNTARARQFFAAVLAAAGDMVPEADFGENGHVIHFCKRYPQIVATLDRRWNNNADPQLNDYIRHYSAGGPMRDCYRFSASEQIWRRLPRLRNGVAKLIGPNAQPRAELGARLQRRLPIALRDQPDFRPPRTARVGETAG